MLKENQELIDTKFDRSNNFDLLRRTNGKSNFFQPLNLNHNASGSSIGYSARQMKNTPMSMKSIGLVSATELASDEKRDIYN